MSDQYDVQIVGGPQAGPPLARGIDQPGGPLEMQTLDTLQKQLQALAVKSGGGLPLP